MTDAPEAIADVATGALLAREIDRARAGLPAVGHDLHEACANCGTHRAGPYCHSCGQAGHVHRTLFSLVHDLAHGVFHFEGKIWATLPLLAWRPGELTRRYVAGERAKFVSPLALFLFSVFLLFAIVPHLEHRRDGGRAAGGDAYQDGRRAGLETRIATLRSIRAAMPTADARRRINAKIAATQADIAAFGTKGAAPVASAPASGEDKDDLRGAAVKIDTGLPFVNYAIRHAAENPGLTAYKLKTYAYKYSWVLIPISVPFIWLLFAFRRDVGGYDHAIFVIYSLSFMSLGIVVLAILSWLGLPGVLVMLAVLAAPPVHMYRQLKGAYALGRFGALWRTAAMLLVSAIASALFFSFLVYMQSE